MIAMIFYSEQVPLIQKLRSVVLALLAASGGMLITSCAASTHLGQDEPGSTLSLDDPRLLQLGLLYDDTIVTESGRTVDFNGQAIVPRLIHVEKSGSGSELTVDTAIVNAVFGLNSNFTVKLGLPYVTKRLDQPGVAPTLRSSGLGDAPLIGKYRFYQKTGLAETTEAAAIFGFELPTGRDGVRDAGMLLPAGLQPGSGSLDAILGGAITRVDGRWLGNADLIAKLNTEANDFRFGNVFRADIGGQYRAVPARYSRFDQLTVNLLVELNSVWLGGDKSNGIDVANSGGFKLFATPGIQVILNRYFLIEAAIQLPIVSNLNGNQLEEDFVAILGIRARF